MEHLQSEEPFSSDPYFSKETVFVDSMYVVLEYIILDPTVSERPSRCQGNSCKALDQTNNFEIIFG